MNTPTQTNERTKELKSLISQLADGTIFSVMFVKRTTGERREMLCRLGVRKGIKGDSGLGRAYDPLDKGLLTVYDMQRFSWRSIPVEGIEWLKIKGEVYFSRKEPQ